ncbi:glycosyltransferase [Wukongibacter sp. M2B1]|uniref:glycosyltransferase n=1 Tax=Wukongibacter sp. M2B1 TaxID=3088895 RepID=UPI003D7BA074
MKILLYPHIYQNGGTGNVLRLYYLYKYIIDKYRDTQILFTSNNIELAKKVIGSIGGQINIENFNLKESFDTIIYDSPIYNKEKIKKLKKHGYKLIALDFFDYADRHVDIIINLFNHKKENIENFKGKIYEGLKYCILRNDIINSKEKIILEPNEKLNVLVTFGGEDPNSNTFEALSRIDYSKTTAKVILGYLNKDRDKIIDKYSNKAEIIDPTPHIGKLISSSDLIICGGGTTLLESIYLGNPIITIPQNQQEKHFIDYVRRQAPLFNINDLATLIEQVRETSFRNNIRNKYEKVMDKKGIERICQLVVGGKN